MIIIANICGTGNVDFCNNDVLHVFCDWQGDEYFQFSSEEDVFSSEGDENEDGCSDEDFERWAAMGQKDRVLPWQNICPDDWSFCVTDCGVPDEEIPF